MPGKSYCKLLGLLLCLCNNFQALINPLVCWFCWGALGLVQFQVLVCFLLGGVSLFMHMYLQTQMSRGIKLRCTVRSVIIRFTSRCTQNTIHLCCIIAERACSSHVQSSGWFHPYHSLVITVKGLQGCGCCSLAIVKCAWENVLAFPGHLGFSAVEHQKLPA